MANDNTAGLSDIRAGVKYALIADCCQFLTLQLRVFADTGDGDRGLGTAHPSIEPGILFQQDNECFSFFLVNSEPGFRSIPTKRNFPCPPRSVDQEIAQDYARGTARRYGLGVGYDLFDSCFACQPVQTTLVTEFVGWTILGGLKERTLTPFEPIEDPPGTLNPDFLEDQPQCSR